MSFILDALRKSEQERQHSSVPTVSSVPLAVPQPRTPIWAGALILGLCIAVTGLGWLWWQDRQTYSARQLEQPAVGPAAAPPAGVAPTVPPISLRQLAEPAGGVAQPNPHPADPVRPPSPGALESTGSASLPRAESAVPGASAAPEAPALPTRGELLAQGIDVPPLELQLHVYSDEAARRFVFLNGSKYVEGDTLPGGPRVVEITTEGVRLQQSGREFFMARN